MALHQIYEQNNKEELNLYLADYFLSHYTGSKILVIVKGDTIISNDLSLNHCSSEEAGLNKSLIIKVIQKHLTIKEKTNTSLWNSADQQKIKVTYLKQSHIYSTSGYFYTTKFSQISYFIFRNNFSDFNSVLPPWCGKIILHQCHKNERSIILRMCEQLKKCGPITLLKYIKVKVGIY